MGREQSPSRGWNSWLYWLLAKEAEVNGVEKAISVEYP